MKNLTLLLILPALLCHDVVNSQAQPFQQETNTIPVEIYDWQPFAPFTKGYTGTTPELCDIDGDGDLDFFLGNGYPQVSYFQNSGSYAAPLFEFITLEYQNLAPPGGPSGYAGGSSPKFCDIDADGDEDAFISGSEARTKFYENTGTSTVPIFVLVLDSLLSSSGVPVYGEHLDLVDIDADGDFDLFAGRYFGWINFYENVGTPDSFSFQLVESQFEGIDVGDWADPHFVDLDEDSDFDLLVGNWNGHVWEYENIGNSISWNFQLITSNYNDIDVYNRATPVTAKIDGDADFDLFVGRSPNQNPNAPRGDVHFWENTGTAQIADFEYITSEYLTMDEGNSCNGDLVDIDADGDVDMLLGSGTDVSFFENIGTAANPSFVLQTEQFAGLTFIGAGPMFYDLDSDGDLDLSDSEGFFTYERIEFYENIGTPQSPAFRYRFELYQAGAFGGAHTLVDIDADGDGDLFFVDGWGDFYYFENEGTPSVPSFTFVTSNFQNLSAPAAFYPTFVDWDADSDFDLFLSVGGLFNFYENVGNAAYPQFSLSASNYFGQNYGGKVSFADIDADSDPDFFFSGAGGVSFVRNLAVNAVPPVQRHPLAGTQLSFGPNPANPVTVITFSLPYPQEAILAVYNLLGARVNTLTSGLRPAGQQSFLWDARGNASGVYIVRLEAAGEIQAGKLFVLK